MPTLEQIQEQIKALGTAGKVDTFGTKKEIRYLPEILDEEESVLYLTSGLMDGNTWLVVCTPKRVIFLDKGMIYGLKQRETPLERINSIEQSTGLLMGEIGITDGSSKMVLKNCIKATVKPFVAAVNRAREAQKKVAAAPVASIDPMAQLERLGALLAQGVLTDEEFQTQKAKILSQM